MPTSPVAGSPGEAVAASPPPADAGAHRALYRRWRAQRFSEVIGQDPIVTTLRQAIAGGRPAHAYLFVGPRGTGKTSTARILAKAINCTASPGDGEPCDACPACVAVREGRALDVIEIDAASHGLVEDARDLVMRALTAPSELRKRVYIIDEVHMLSTHAFNALLKLVEEPPDHVVFVLATTDTHKVPPTIISRTQRFDFRRLPDDLIAGKLARITVAEGAEAEPEALALLARLAEGGMRDAESLLDQVLAYAGGHVTLGAVREAVGLADEAAIRALVDAYVAADAGAALRAIDTLAAAGRDMAQVAAQAVDEARTRLLASAADPPRARRLAIVLRSLAEAAGAGAREGRSRLLLELLSVEPATALAPAPVVPSPQPVKTPPPAAAAAAMPSRPVAVREQPPTDPAPSTPPSGRETRAEARPEPAEQAPSASAGARASELTVAEVRTRWVEVVAHATPVIKPLLSECRPVALDGARLTLGFPEGREFMRANISRRAPAIEQLLASIFGGAFAVECVATNVELEPLTVAEAIGGGPDDEESKALLEGVLKITGGELVDAPEVR